MNEAAVDKAFGEAKNNAKGKKSVILDFKSSGAHEVAIDFPIQAIQGEESAEIIVQTAFSTIVLPPGVMDMHQLGEGDKVTFDVTLNESVEMSDDVKAKVGNRPILDINFRVNGKVIAWKNGNAPVKISIPYTPTEDELINPDQIIVYYIDENQQLQVVPTGRYDATSGNVVFKTTHFSRYAVSVDSKTFDDITKSWAKSEIEALAVRNIINGTSATTFNPDAQISRADFTNLLVDVLGQTAESQQSFSDIESKGVLKRQEMMVLIERALSISDIALSEEAPLSTFSDMSEVSIYAQESVSRLVASGIIQGNNGKLRPQDSMTRAEAARVLYLVYNIINKDN